MSGGRRSGRRLHRLAPREDVERELRLHLIQRTEELIAEGWAPEAAQREARRLFGDYAAIHDESVAIASRHDRSKGRSRMWSELRLAGIGAAVGLLLAFALLRFVIAMGPDAVPRLHEVRLDARVVAFTMLLGFATALLFGIFPALRATRGDTYDMIRGAGRGTQSAGQRRAWTWLTGAEVALAILLLVGSGLLIRSFHRLTNVDTGFDPDDKLTVQISLPARFEGAMRTQVLDEITDRVRALPRRYARGTLMDDAARRHGPVGHVLHRRS